MGEEGKMLIPIEDLKEVWIGPLNYQVTKLGTYLFDFEEEVELVVLFTRNIYLFS